jgi:hypothetical protein
MSTREGFTPGATKADRDMAEGTAALKQWARANAGHQKGEWRQGSSSYKALHKKWKGGLCRGMALNWVRNEVSGADQPTLTKPVNPAQESRLKAFAARDVKTHDTSAGIFTATGGKWVDKQPGPVQRFQARRDMEEWSKFTKKSASFENVRLSPLCSAMLNQNPPPKTDEVWKFVSSCLSYKPRRSKEELKNTQTKRFMERVGFLITFASPIGKDAGHAIAVCRMEDQSFRAYDPNLPTYEFNVEQLETWFHTIWDSVYSRQAYTT